MKKISHVCIDFLGPWFGRPRLTDNRQVATELGSPDLSKSRRLVPCCAYGAGKGFAAVVTAPEEPHQDRKIGSNFVHGWECKARYLFYINM